MGHSLGSKIPGHKFSLSNINYALCENLGSLRSIRKAPGKNCRLCKVRLTLTEKKIDVYYYTNKKKTITRIFYCGVCTIIKHVVVISFQSSTYKTDDELSLRISFIIRVYINLYKAKNPQSIVIEQIGNVLCTFHFPCYLPTNVFFQMIWWPQASSSKD